MIDRCKPGNKDARYYFEKGIVVCCRWMKFENFLEDMGLRPSETHSLDRIRNSEGYCSDNCRWATKEQQSQNSVQSKIWTINGIDYPSARSAGLALGVTAGAIRQWCHGKKSGDYFYPPRPGCTCSLLYPQREQL
jgi:hypothetical protein